MTCEFKFFPLLQPAMSPRRLCLFNTKTGASKRDLNFKTSILAVRLSRKRLATTSMYLSVSVGVHSYVLLIDACQSPTVNHVLLYIL